MAPRWAHAKASLSVSTVVVPTCQSHLSRLGQVSVIRGFWTSEEEQRNFGQRVVAGMPGGATHVLVVDGDEVLRDSEYHPARIDKCFVITSFGTPSNSIALSHLFHNV